MTDGKPHGNDAHRTRVMLLGTGEFSRELSTALRRLGAHVIVAGQHPGANVAADESLVVDLTNAEELTAAIHRAGPHVLVATTEAVAGPALTSVADSGSAEVLPTPRSARLTADREALRRLAADELGLPTAPFWFAGSVDELRAIADHAGYPLRVQPLAAVGAEGQSVVLAPADVESAWQRAVDRRTHNRVLAETIVDVDFHVTLLTVRSTGPTGPTIEFCAPIGHGEAIGDVQESWQPHDLSPFALDAAKSIAARIVTSLGGRGVFGVELMIRGDEVYFSDLTARPFETALVTLRTQRLSAFELQARALLGLPVDTIMVSPGAAEVIYTGTGGSELGGVLADALRVPESDVRVFGPAFDTRQPLGAAVVTASDVNAARSRAREVSTALRTLW